MFYLNICISEYKQKLQKQLKVLFFNVEISLNECKKIFIMMKK